METRKFNVGDRVRVKPGKKLSPYLMENDLCMLGYDETAFAAIEWDKRGDYGFEFFTGNAEEMFDKV